MNRQWTDTGFWKIGIDLKKTEVICDYGISRSLKNFAFSGSFLLGSGHTSQVHPILLMCLPQLVLHCSRVRKFATSKSPA